MVTVELEPDIEERIRHFALENQVSESFLIREAVLRWLEDREDYSSGLKALSQMKYIHFAGRDGAQGRCGRLSTPISQKQIFFISTNLSASELSDSFESEFPHILNQKT